MGDVTLQEGDFDALIFDMDGTLVNSMPIHYRAWCAELEMHDMSIAREEYYSLGGMPAADVARLLIARFGRGLDPVEVASGKEQRFLELLGEVPVFTAVETVVRAWHGRVPLAIATGSRARVTERILAGTGLVPFFEAIITREDYVEGKPAPAPYLRAAEALGVDPTRALAFEDAEMGFQSVRAAGMRLVRVVPVDLAAAPTEARLLWG